MGGSEEHGYGGHHYPPLDPNFSVYPPPPPPQQGMYPPIPPQDRAFDPPSYPPPYPNPPAPPPPHHDHHHGHPPPPPPHHHDHHHHHHGHHDSHPPPPPPPREHEHHHHGHHGHHHGHHSEEVPANHDFGQLVKLCCQANMDFSLAARYDGVVLVPSNNHDESQQWYKDMSWSTRVKDERGFPAFALVNKATKMALKHSSGELQQVVLVDYNPSVVDESVLWTVSEDMGSGYRTIRMASNIKLNLDAFRGNKRSGGIKDGTPAVLYRWLKQENQLWKIIPL